MELKEYAKTLNFKKKKELYNELAKRFNISSATAKKYYELSGKDIPNPDKPKEYKSVKSKINGYRNMVFKMLKDRIKPVVIKEYAKYKGFSGTERSIEQLISRISVNNFNEKLNIMTFTQSIEIPGLAIIKRNDLLKYITTKNKRIKKDTNIDKYIQIIKEKYLVINNIIDVYNDFYNIFIEKKEVLLDNFIKKYESEIVANEDTGEIVEEDDNIENVKSGISGFIKSIKKDIAPIKAAISFSESSGFVEGNNNKFKLIKRILYGRCNLVNLFKKCFSIFSLKSSDNIFKLLNFYSSIPNCA